MAIFGVIGGGGLDVSFDVNASDQVVGVTVVNPTALTARVTVGKSTGNASVEGSFLPGSTTTIPLTGPRRFAHAAEAADWYASVSWG